MNKIWPVPLVAFVVMFGREGGGASLYGIVDMPSWWPFLKHSAAEGIRNLVYIPFVIPVVLGYGDVAVTKAPGKKCRSSALKLAAYSLILIVLSVIASKIKVFAFAAALFAPVAHEMIIRYGAKEEEEGEPYFISNGIGVKVLYVHEDSIASSMKIEAGDTILKINGITLYNEKQLTEFLGSYHAFIWTDIRKTGGKVITSEYSDYRNGIGSLGALTVPDNAEFHYEISKGSSLIKRLIEGFKNRHDKGTGL